ncbi:hypothetical protein [Actinoplanes xinjiangensis]|uniref:hypothetical protein n=1 Tax=Actinoplanes xinjiangensis TaxID=512350 RepID=UPI0034347103
MTMFLLGVIVSIITGLLVNELCDVSPWMARKIVRWSARMWAHGDPDLVSEYEEAWTAVVDDTPGKLTKLFSALRFAAGATGVAGRRRVDLLAQQVAGRVTAVDWMRVADVIEVILVVGVMIITAAEVGRQAFKLVAAWAGPVTLALGFVWQAIHLVTRAKRRKRRRPAGKRWPWWPFD